MNKFIVFLLLLTSANLKAQTYNGPESVEYDYTNGRWLIANTSSHQVLARSSSGALTIFATLTGSGPYGIEIAGDTLFCCNGGSIKGFLLSSGTPVFNLNLSASFLNGITHDNNGNLYLTDFNGLKIYKVNVAAQTFTTVASNLVQKPNGIIYDNVNNRCVFVNWGTNAPVKAIDLITFAVTTLVTTTLSNCDGIAADAQGNYYVSNWGTSSVKKFNNNFTLTPTTVATGLSSPADIFYNVAGDTLAIPNSGNNTVTFIGFSSTGVNDLLKEININVSPNPVNENTTIAFSLQNAALIKIELTDVNGKIIKEVYNCNGQKTLEGSIVLSKANLKPGIYFLKFDCDGKTYTKKIVFE